jgi:endoglucanase Acf2
MKKAGWNLSKRFNSVIATLVACVMLFGTASGIGFKVSAAASNYLLSLNRPCSASTTNGGDVPSRATDGDMTTAWGAQSNLNNQWIDVDLGAAATISSVTLNWQSQLSYATQYMIQASSDEVTWTTIYTNTNGNGGTQHLDSNGNPYYVENINLSGTGRYVRMYAQKSVSGYGVSLYEFQVYGTGGINPLPEQRTNLALNKTATASSTLQPWWSVDSNGNVTTPLTPAQAVDGNSSTYWLSNGDNDEWFQVDLGAVYTIGEVDITWDSEFGRVYDLQTSLDGQNWTTVYRQQNGIGKPETIPLYASTRYVRMQGIAMGMGGGYSIHEFQVWSYVSGDPQTTYTIAPLTTPTTVDVGSGSYVTGDQTMTQPRYPEYVTSNVKAPIPSNDWWTSAMITRLSDGMTALPLVYQYFDNGLGFYYASKLFTAPNNGGMDTKNNNEDLFIDTSSIVKTPSAKVDGYGDWSTNIIYSDDNTAKMESTLIKGSPYEYNTFTDPNSVEVSTPNIIGLFDDSNNPILVNDGDTYTGDHVGIEVQNTDTAPTPDTLIHDYGIFAPASSTFIREGGKILVHLGGGNNYMSVGVLTQRSDLNYMYQHAYAFVTNTTVTYNYNNASSNVTTTYTDTISLKRTGFSGNTIQSLFPTQWKDTSVSFAPVTYTSARGTMKSYEGNSISTTLKFYGITPSLGIPLNSSSYTQTQLMTYLNEFQSSVTSDYWVADPYWEGKKLEPLAMGILVCDQIGDYTMRDQYISILRKILENWFTYSGDDDTPYYMYYSPSWGTLNGQGGDHGMAMNLSDHHFLWGYFIFSAAVLASYDDNFKTQYGGMVEELIRDTMNPSKTDSQYPFMRNFDVYEGHSWAGGYGDNQSGNNQESSSEATFAWAGEYLWGLVTSNNTYRDAGIWGFTNEVNAIQQYYFNMDGDNWTSDYASGDIGMLWGSAYTNGTYFSGNPCCIYGIQMLPVTPVITYLGYNPTEAGKIYSKYTAEEVAYQAKLAAETPPASDPEGWFHITWPFEALSDPQTVINKWDDTVLPNDEVFFTYWFVQNMNSMGTRSTDIWSSNWTSYQVFKKGTQYSAVIWNPTSTTQYVTFCNANGQTGSAYVLAKTTLVVDPTKNSAVPTTLAPPAPVPDPAPIALPGQLNANNYYTNFSCAPAACSEGGNCIGYINTGSKLEYQVNVPTSGTYNVVYRYNNSNTAAGQVQFKSSLSGSSVLASANLPVNNGWSNVSTTVQLQAGTQTLSLLFTGAFNFENANFSLKGNGGTVSTPTITPATGAYSSAQSVTMSDSIQGTTIRYTTDGSTPTESNGTVYTGSFVISSSQTIKAIAYESGMTDSAVVSSVITVNATNVALNKTATASSVNVTNTAALAFDSDTQVSRWESAYSDPQWIEVDLGANTTISSALLSWQTAAAKAYSIQVSTDNTNWTTVYSESNGAGRVENISFTPVNARYVRMYGTARTTGYGYSLYDFEVFRSASTTVATPTITPASGTFTSTQSITIADSTSGSTIRYTTDGSAPTETNGKVYTGAFNVSATTTVKAIAYLSGSTDSAVASSTITINSSSGTNLALNKTATASSVNGTNTAALAFDSDPANTRWESAASDPQWIEVDLGASYNVNGAKLVWETAAAKAYSIQVSTDNTNWTTVYSESNGTGGTANLTFTATTARYVRMYGTVRTTGYGYSLWDFEVFGTSGTTVATPTITPATGTFTSAQSVTISDNTSGATIRYTTDGSTPSETNGTVYSGAFNVSATTTVKAIAYMSGSTDSAVASSILTINLATTNLALNKTATASSVNGTNTAALAFDSDPANTRWESAYSDPQWIEVDLGANHSITGAKLVWKTAAAKAYSIQVSTDNTNWTTVYSESNGAGGTENLTFTAGTARYVRMYGTARTTGYGYSLWDFEVFGS